MKRESPGEPGRSETAARTSSPNRSTPHEVEMRILADRIRWLDGGHEHWWLRQLRWHRERNGPECACRTCTWEAA
jgi:hypothetical protein